MSKLKTPVNKPSEGKMISILRFAFFPVLLFIVQLIFTLIALNSGKGVLYLKVAVPVWLLVVFLYAVAQWLTHNARKRSYSSAAMMIVVFSGFLMAIGCLTQTIMINNSNKELNASKYILFQIYQYANGEQASDLLHTTGKDYQEGTIDTFISKQQAENIILSCNDNSSVLMHLSEDGESEIPVEHNYEIRDAAAQKAISYLSDYENFPAYSNILKTETTIRVNKAARSLVLNYITALIAGLLITLLILFMHGHYYDYWILWLVLLEIVIFILLKLLGSGGDNASINLFGLQPLEFMKFIYILVLADLVCKPERGSSLARITLPGKNRKSLGINRYVVAILFVGLNAAGYMFCGEMGTMLITGCVGICMIFIFCDRFIYRVLLMGLSGLAAAAILFMAKFKIGENGAKLYSRIHCFLTPEEDPYGKGYQYIQLRQSLSVSGLFGAKDRYSFSISQGENDTVFNSLIQSRGLIFGLLVIVLFIGLLLVAYRAALRASDIYYRGLGLACCLLLGFQGMIHISYNVGLFPITGVPLMYISAGGSNMAVSMIITVLLIVISSNHMIRAVSDEEEIDEMIERNRKFTFIKRFFMNFAGTLKRSFSISWIR